MTSSFKGTGTSTYELVKIQHCIAQHNKLLGIGKLHPTFPHRVQGLNHRPQIGRQVVLATTSLNPCHCGLAGNTLV